MLFVSLVPMDCFCKTNTETDVATLHYLAFIEPLTVSPKEALSFDSKQFTNNSNNKVIEEKTTYNFLLLEEHFGAANLFYKKMKFNSNLCRTNF
jgi:hypothetical protein